MAINLANVNISIDEFQRWSHGDYNAGDVTVVCTEPKDFPVKFRWTATVAVDGTVTSTPLVIVQQQ